MLIAIFICIGLLAVRFDKPFDLTLYQRNVLKPISQKIVQQLTSPLMVTAFARGNSSVKALINRQLAKYRTYADIQLIFKNPDTEIDLVNQYNITRDGELLLSYEGKTTHVGALTETAITRGIYTLLEDKLRKILFVTGHGERSLDNTNRGYGALYERLISNKMKVGQVDLAISKKVPDNTDLLVIADPKIAYTDNQVSAIVNYIEAGGRLLWLAEHDSSRLPGLVSALGVTSKPSVLINRSGKKYKLDNNSYMVIEPQSDTRKSQPILSTINTMLLFPVASPITVLPTVSAKNWQVIPLLHINAESFLKRETTILKAPASVDIGLLLTAESIDKTQKVVVIGDADFASNQFIGFGQNADFSLNLFRYLVMTDNRFININDTVPPPVVISERRLGYLAIVFIVVLPLFILLIGAMVRRYLRAKV
ncbi:MAG: GldG family protein [Ostreibacterium sp.]